MDGLEKPEYAGELAENEKLSTHNAAQQALAALQPLIDSLPSKQGVKRKSPATETVAGNNACNTAKVDLNSACMKIARRALQKGETVYDCQPTTEGGYQATVTINCLPNDNAGRTWAGEVRS